MLCLHHIARKEEIREIRRGIWDTYGFCRRTYYSGVPTAPGTRQGPYAQRQKNRLPLPPSPLPVHNVRYFTPCPAEDFSFFRDIRRKRVPHGNSATASAPFESPETHEVDVATVLLGSSSS